MSTTEHTDGRRVALRRVRTPVGTQITRDIRKVEVLDPCAPSIRVFGTACLRLIIITADIRT